MTTTQVPSPTRSRPGTGHRARPSPAGRTGPAVPRQVAFWLLALVLAVTMLGTTLPTPLYVIYQDRWHFSAAMVTVTFAVYAAAVIATLLLAGVVIPHPKPAHRRDAPDTLSRRVVARAGHVSGHHRDRQSARWTFRAMSLPRPVSARPARP
jgi:hypothetical protein